jgi:carbamoyltransferase
MEETLVRVLGITKPQTSFGKPLRSGGCALAIDGEVVAAMAEERAAGVKHASGYQHSLHRVIGAAGISMDDIDVIAVSTCCEPEANALQDHDLAGDERLVSVNHHLSHAVGAFQTSGFERALIMVADGGGNVLTDLVDAQWWRQPREQHSYYLASASGIQLIDRDLSGPFDVGFGEMYRAFTYFLGWHSSRYASRLMALAAYGRRKRIPQNLYELCNGQLTSPIVNNPAEPIQMVEQLGEVLGADFGEPRVPGGAILQIHKDVAAYVQEQLELALVRRLRLLVTAYRVDAICIAGGVALNVLANGRLIREHVCDRVYVPPAPADDGQCLGNAIAATLQKQAGTAIKSIRNSSAAALGPTMRTDSRALNDALHAQGKTRYTVIEDTSLATTIARLLASGSAVATFQGRSEFGPRALGQRSILGDPRDPDVRNLFNSLKGREWFQPFAPAVLAEDVAEWFEEDVKSPFMSFGIRIQAQKRQRVPAAVSHDGTARIQTVEPAERSLLRDVITEFKRLTGVPMVLNTSFNRGGHPIVETLDDALQTFGDLAINVLALERFIVIKELSPELSDLDVLPAKSDVGIAVVQKDHLTAVSKEEISIRKVIRQVQELTGAVVLVRHQFALYARYLDWLREGRKGTTIRFRPGGVEIPKRAVMPLYETPDYGGNQQTHPTATVRVGSVRYQRLEELNEDDARQDGFDSLSAMQHDLRQIYPGLRPRDWITIYKITLVA